MERLGPFEMTGPMQSLPTCVLASMARTSRERGQEVGIVQETDNSPMEEDYDQFDESPYGDSSEVQGASEPAGSGTTTRSLSTPTTAAICAQNPPTTSLRSRP